MTGGRLELPDANSSSKKVIALFNNAVNVDVLENADVTLAYTEPCGDTIKPFLKISEKNVIRDTRFQHSGCPASAACGSIMTQVIRGNTLQEAKAITDTDVLKELNGLPDEECPCAELVVTTLHKTITKYEEMEKKP